MATNRQYLASILGVLALAQNVSDEVLDAPGVDDILKDMDDLATELREVIE